jgi:GNAT superfamily N-acetyltransferase
MPDEFLDGLTVDARTRGWTRWLSEPPLHDVHVAEVGDGIVGFVSTGDPQDPRDRADGRLELYAIYLLEEYTGRGIGRDLIITAEARMQSRDATEAILWVLDGNESTRRFYESGRWEWDGETRPHPIGGPDLTVLRYRKTLG